MFVNKLLSIITGVIVLTSPFEVIPRAVVDRIEDNYAVIEFFTDKTYNMLNVPVEYISGKVSECREVPVTKTEGKFYCGFLATDCDGYENTYYQFCSDDNEIWWILTAETIGFVPDMKTQYALYFYDNGTAKDNPPCDCPEEYKCECYCYDDIFLGIEVAE